MSYNNKITEEYKTLIEGITYNSQSKEMWFKGKLLTSEQRDEVFKLIAKGDL